MATSYTHFGDLAQEVRPPDKGILSRTLSNDDRLKVVLFGFGRGEELSEHTTSMPAVLHFLQGEAKLTLGDDTLEAKPGTWVHMPKGLRHSIQAQTPVVVGVDHRSKAEKTSGARASEVGSSFNGAISSKARATTAKTGTARTTATETSRASQARTRTSRAKSGTPGQAEP